MNVQYAIKDGDIYVLEVNPRASRTVPFVAKVIGLPVAKIAARVMAGEPLAELRSRAAAAATMSASRRRCSRSPASPGVDTVLGPEMRSTGEVMGLDHSFEIAFAKSQLGGGSRLPRAGTVFVSVRDVDKPRILAAARLLSELGFKVIATGGTQRYLAENGVTAAQDQQGGWKAGRTSSMPSKTAMSSWSSIPPRGRPPWPTAGRCGAPPSCIKSRTTPLFQGPSRRRRGSKPISGATSRCARCRAISAAEPELVPAGASDGTKFGREVVRSRSRETPVSRSELCSA